MAAALIGLCTAIVAFLVGELYTSRTSLGFKANAATKIPPKPHSAITNSDTAPRIYSVQGKHVARVALRKIVKAGYGGRNPTGPSSPYTLLSLSCMGSSRAQ